MVIFLFPFNFISKFGKYFPCLYFTWLHIVVQFIFPEWRVIIFEEGIDKGYMPKSLYNIYAFPQFAMHMVMMNLCKL
jgi:hypothetical protein